MDFLLEVTVARDSIKTSATYYKCDTKITVNQKPTCVSLFPLVELLNEIRLSESTDF